MEEKEEKKEQIQEKKKLKDCPFCGKNVLTIFSGRNYLNGKFGVKVYCRNCGASGAWRDTREEAIQAWEQRG